MKPMKCWIPHKVKIRFFTCMATARSLPSLSTGMLTVKAVITTEPAVEGNLLAGALGFVLIPDLETQKRSRKLAEDLASNHAQYYLKEADLPHVTLYHGKVQNVPQEFLSA